MLSQRLKICFTFRVVCETERNQACPVNPTLYPSPRFPPAKPFPCLLRPPSCSPSVQYDSNAGALQSWLESKPWLAELVTPEGHEAVQLASAECRKVIADRLYFMGRYKLTSGPPEHKSMTSVVSRSTLDSYTKPPHPPRSGPPSYPVLRHNTGHPSNRLLPRAARSAIRESVCGL